MKYVWRFWWLGALIGVVAQVRFAERFLRGLVERDPMVLGDLAGVVIVAALLKWTYRRVWADSPAQPAEAGVEPNGPRDETAP